LNILAYGGTTFCTPEDIIKSPEDLAVIDKQLQELKLDPSQLERESQTDIIETLNFYNDVLDKLETAQLGKALTQSMVDQRIGQVRAEKHQLEIYLAKNIQLPEPVCLLAFGHSS
jgi:hypothetical protein